MNSEQRARKLLAEEVGCAVEDLETAFIQRDDAVRAIARALEQSSVAPVGVDALEVFRIAGGDTECEPNPTPERALEVLRDLRACYDEALTAAKSQTERTTQVDDDAGKDFFVVVAAFVLIVLGTVFLLSLK